jgi:hypothetical protein
MRLASRIAGGARAVGTVGLAVGAYVDGKSLYEQYNISQHTGDYSNTTKEAVRIGAAWTMSIAMGQQGALLGAEIGTFVGGPVGFVVGGLIGGALFGGFGYYVGSQLVEKGGQPGMRKEPNTPLVYEGP